MSLASLVNIIHYFFAIYTVLLFVRVLASWVPALAGHPIMRFIAFYTDPYLNLFRRIIPPLGGVLDLSPLLGCMALKLIEKFLVQCLT